MNQQLQASGYKRGFRWWSKRAVLAGGALIVVLGVSLWLVGGAPSSDLVERYPASGQSTDVIQSMPTAENETETTAKAPSEAVVEADAETTAETPSETTADVDAETSAEAPSEAAAEADAETEPQGDTESDTEAKAISFATNVLPIFEARCADCHGTDGGWDGSSYEFVMTTGDHAPVVIPGDVRGSLLAQKLVGTQEEGRRMPPWPSRKLSDDLILVILDWIAAGAPE